jgi:GT2 family glycosyltransferase
MELNKISVVIVSFHRAEKVRESLAALAAPAAEDPATVPGGELQVIVVENGSRATAGLGEEFPQVRFNRLQRNFGLTRALNIGIRAADGEYILLMHDDVRMDVAAVIELAEFLESRPDVGAVCPKFTGKQVRPLPTPADPDPAFQVAIGGDEIAAECVSGAAIMVRAAFLRSMGHIDERYGNYGSDIEICAQVRSSNRKVIVLGRVAAEHGSEPSPMPKRHLDGDRAAGTAAFLGKHYGFGAGLWCRIKTSLLALITLRFSVLGARKIDGWG